jgi:hydrogenase maturation protease
MDTMDDPLAVVVAGFGSPHGDDQAGWKVVAGLAQLQVPARLVGIREGTQLVNELEGCRKLIAVDACRSTDRVGTIWRFRWPDARIRSRHTGSTHGIGLCSALELAEQLGRLPADVEVFGVEIGDIESVGPMSAQVARAVTELEAILRGEICEMIHA